MSQLVTVYQAANNLDASMLRDHLVAERIEAVVLGEHLQGGVGELPAFGLVKVAVAAHQASRARDVVARYEADLAGDSSGPDGQVGPGYLVVPAEPGHLAALPDIERAAATMLDSADLPEALRNDVTDMATLVDACASNRLFVAVQVAGHNDGQGEAQELPVGFALVRQVDGLPHLQELDVHPDHGRQGLGRSLVQAVLEQAAAQGAKAVTLTTFSHLPWNAPFYRSLGFVTLATGDLSPGLAQELADEAAAGMDPARRIAMRWQVR